MPPRPQLAALYSDFVNRLCMTVRNNFMLLRPRSRGLSGILILAIVMSVTSTTSIVSARTSSKAKGAHAKPQRFMRQQNTYSNMQFYLTNRGVLFNNDNGAGLFWPRGTNNVYIFGGGVWFATKKVLQGRRQKLAEIGYNPNSGAGWFAEGEVNPAPDGASPESKYITYFSPRYDKTSGKYTGGVNVNVPPPTQPWPIWDTAKTRVLRKNFYFGDYISNVTDRNPDKLGTKTLPDGSTLAAKPAMLSQEDIVNVYTDVDVSNNPEYRANRGYPFNLDILEVLYTWSFGRYRDMMFIRHRITNASTNSRDTLYDCYIAPAFDPDLGEGSGSLPAGNDRNAFMSIKTLAPEDTNTAKKALVEADTSNRFGGDLENLNMAFQFSEKEKGKEFGMIGFAFLESPVVDDNGTIIQNSDPAALGKKQLGLTTFKKWNINNDPSTQDLRYDFVSEGSRDADTGPADVRLLFSTGPFTLPPGQSAETVVGVGIAQKSTTDRKQNLDTLVRLMVQAHNVFARESIAGITPVLDENDDTVGYDTTYVVDHFEAPEPPMLDTCLNGVGLDKAVLLTWCDLGERSEDPLATGLPFLGYELYRSTRADLDSTIQPEGASPIVRLGRWTLYDMKEEPIYEDNQYVRTRYTRLNNTPRELPHSFLDVGDDNGDGTVSGDEGLVNGVRYYYYLVSFDEYDSVNNIGPLETAIVKDKNFTSAVPTKPPYIETPLVLGGALTTGDPNTSVCFANGGLDTVRLDVIDTGRFQSLYLNDVIKVVTQPRWVEWTPDQNIRGTLFYYFDVTDTARDLRLTYDALNNPGSTDEVKPYGEFTGLRVMVPGSQGDSIWKATFTSDDAVFTPNMTVDQTFRLIVDYNMKRLEAPYRVESVKVEGADKNIVRLSARTLNETRKNAQVNYDALDTSADSTADTRPHFLGSLGEATYEITFGAEQAMEEWEFDTLAKLDTLVRSLHDGDARFTPRVLPITIRSLTHCGAELQPIRDGRSNDYEPGLNAAFVNDSVIATSGVPIAGHSDPDSMLVPIPGKFAVDAFHFSYDEGTPASDGSKFITTTGNYYYPFGKSSASAGKRHAAVHRIRVGGAEIILNAPGVSGKELVGDETDPSPTPTNNDFSEGDKITISFKGLAQNIPFPDTFRIHTSGDNKVVNFADAGLYTESVLDQIRIVPNPYIVTHQGQTSTDNAKLYFTRLPPRATIEIYNLAGDLIATLEHNAYMTNAQGEVDLQDNSSMLEWNLLSEGRQRIGSQVLIARILGRTNDGALTGAEVTKKFAVVVGGYRIVR